MLKVGKMKFPYTEKGMKDAKNYSKQSGKPMEMEDGGMIPEYGHGGMVKPMMPMYGYGGKVMPKYPGGGMVKPMMKMYKHGGLVMSPMQKMAVRKRLANMMMDGGKMFVWHNLILLRSTV